MSKQPEKCRMTAEIREINGRYYDLVCQRIKGHEGKCISMVRDAYLADGREPPNGPKETEQ